MRKLDFCRDLPFIMDIFRSSEYGNYDSFAENIAKGLKSYRIERSYSDEELKTIYSRASAYDKKGRMKDLLWYIDALDRKCKMYRDEMGVFTDDEIDSILKKHGYLRIKE